jgi:hypothetical protein
VDTASIDPGSICPGGEVGLWTKDPMNRPFWRVPGRFEKKELEDHLLELFPEGLSLHGWQYMLDRHDFIRHPITNDAFVNHTWQVELTFEMVRAVFPKINSRLQSYFAWETGKRQRNPFPLSDMMQQSFEQSCKAMENCIDLFQKNLRASPWFASSDLNKKMQGYMEKNLAAASKFTQKPKDRGRMEIREW